MFSQNVMPYSLSDIAAATGGNKNSGSGLGEGDGAWWIILLFLFAGGWGRGGWGNENGGSGSGSTGTTTVREEIAYGFDINGLENGIRGIQQGLCDGFYAMNTGMLNGFSGVQNAMCQGFSGLHSSINQNTNDIVQAMYSDTVANMQNTNAIIGQLNNMSADNAACCCETQRALERGFSELNYNLATQSCDTRRAITDSTRDILDSQNAGVRSILDFLTQDKIASLQAENQSLKFAASQQAQNAYLVGALKDPCPVPAYVVPNPNCCYGYGYTLTRNTGCSCDNYFN